MCLYLPNVPIFTLRLNLMVVLCLLDQVLQNLYNNKFNYLKLCFMATLSASYFVRAACICLSRISNNSMFPNSTRRGDAEAGDNNQIQVALVLYLSNRGNNRQEAGCWLFG